MEPMKLYTTGELAEILGIRPVVIRQWFGNYPHRLPAPYATYGSNNRRLWSQEQVDAIKLVEANRKPLTGKVNRGRPKDSEVPALHTYDPVLDRTYVICPEEGCGEMVFNLEVHNDFFHKRRLSTKR